MLRSVEGNWKRRYEFRRFSDSKRDDWRIGKRLIEALLVKADFAAWVDRAKEAASEVFVAGSARLFDSEQDGICITVDPCFDDLLRMTTGVSFLPKLISASAEIGGSSGTQSSIPSVAIHPREHQDRSVVGILRDSGEESVGPARKIGNGIFGGHGGRCRVGV